MSELMKRILVAVIFVPVLLFLIYYGGLSLIALFFVFSILGYYEYLAMLRNAKQKISYWWLVLGAGVYFSFVFTRGFDIALVWAVFSILLLSSLFKWSNQASFLGLIFNLFGLLYTSVLPALIVRISIDWKDKKILLALILMIWFVDSVAYFVGMRFGKHRNVTGISPKKSLEGFLAGCVSPIIILTVYHFLEYRPISMLELGIVSVAAGFFGQLGDLGESMLKRYCNVKDSSNFIPGHGGVLDRMDSILLSGSYLYVVLVFLNK
ncbi:MAG: phosphatidate cytidylyltransferase [Candidatus Cloacimonetes bacterium]|nr:phosphatidate cytidylyltransferase [Candidatus Cloacimonadota bacterium]